ncbi:MAG: hypothetical protein WCK51_10205 [Armatimonadota bacterium]
MGSVSLIMIEGEEDEVRNLVDPPGGRFHFIHLKVRVPKPLILTNHVEQMLNFSLAHIAITPGKIIKNALNRPSGL